MHIKATRPYRGRTNGRLIRLEPGDIVPPHLREQALSGGWGEEVKAESAKSAKKPGEPMGIRHTGEVGEA